MLSYNSKNSNIYIYLKVILSYTKYGYSEIILIEYTQKTLVKYIINICKANVKKLKEMLNKVRESMQLCSCKLKGGAAQQP